MQSNPAYGSLSNSTYETSTSTVTTTMDTIPAYATANFTGFSKINRALQQSNINLMTVLLE